MSIVWRPASGNFADTLFNTLLSLEASTTLLRWNLQKNVETPTIGIGFDLKTGATEGQEVLREFGFDVVGAWPDKPVAAGTPQAKEQQYIKDLFALFKGESKVQATYDAIMAKRKADIESDTSYAQYISSDRRRSTFTFNNDTEIRNVFDAVWPRYLKRIKDLIKNPSVTNDPAFPSSKELLALACTLYVGTFGSKAAKTISDGNRVSDSGWALAVERTQNQRVLK